MFHFFQVARMPSESVSNQSLFAQLNHRSRFFLLPQGYGCCLMAGLSLTLRLSCHHAAVLAATSGWKPSSGPLQCQLAGICESYSFQLTLLCHFRNQSCFPATRLARVFHACRLQQLFSAPSRSPGDVPTHWEPPLAGDLRGNSPQGRSELCHCPGFYSAQPAPTPNPQFPSSLCSNFYLFSSLAFKQRQWNNARCEGFLVDRL